MKKLVTLVAALALFAGPALADDKKPADASKPATAAACCKKDCKGGEKCHEGKKSCDKDCKEACCKKADAPKS
ncbi:MAG TPA: hypothetical protein PK598_08435 [Thermoanaerobaculia bacterium]|nr:hypothetical protein [Thermoanaerobaculia bacterium]